MTQLERALATVEHTGERDNCATLHVRGNGAVWTLEYACPIDNDNAVWNIADSPPGEPSERWEKIKSGQNYVEVRAEGDTVDELATEAVSLVNDVAGAGCEVYRVQTRFIGHAPSGRIFELVETAARRIRHRIEGVLP